MIRSRAAVGGELAAEAQTGARRRQASPPFGATRPGGAAHEQARWGTRLAGRITGAPNRG
eukprot:7465464-Alexandrium_andersonii.AAC.1